MAKFPELKYVTAKELREFLARVPDDMRIYITEDDVGYLGRTSWLNSVTYHRSSGIFNDNDIPPDGVELEFG